MSLGAHRERKVKLSGLGSEEMAQSAQRSPHTHEDLSSHLKNLCKKPVMVIYTWIRGGRDRGMPGVYWSVRLSQSVRFKCNEKDCF